MYYVPIIGILMLIESIYIAAVKKTVLVGVSEFGASLVGPFWPFIFTVVSTILVAPALMAVV